MANRVTINRMEFHCVKDGEIYYGFTAYDDYDQCYNNNLNKEDLEKEGLDFLKLIIEGNHADEKLDQMLDFIMENQRGMYIDNKWFDWEEVKNIIGHYDED